MPIQITKLLQLTNTKAWNHQNLPETSSVTCCSKWVGGSLEMLHRHYILPFLNFSYFHTLQSRWIISKSAESSINYLYLTTHRKFILALIISETNYIMPRVLNREKIVKELATKILYDLWPFWFWKKVPISSNKDHIRGIKVSKKLTV